jgi:hypothetical protein
MTKKEFALNHLPKINHIHKKFIFQFFDQEELNIINVCESFFKYIKDNCNSNKNLESIRNVFNGIKWSNYVYGEKVNE